MSRDSLSQVPRRAVVSVVLVALVALAGCSGGAEDPPPQQPPPAFVTAAAAPLGTSRVNLVWGANGVTAAQFRIYRSLVSGSVGAVIATVPASTTTYRDSGLAPNNMYFYTIESVTSASATLRSPQVSATTVPVASFPQDVTGFTVTRIGTTVTLSWDPYPGAATYEIARSPYPELPPGTWGTFTNLYGAVVTSLVDTEIGGAGHYTYSVTVYNFDGSQSAGARAEIDIPVGVLPGVDRPVLDPWASDKDGATVHLYWYHSQGATAEHVYASASDTVITPKQGATTNPPLDGPPHNLPIRHITGEYFAMDVPLSLFSPGYRYFAIEAEDGAALADSGAIGINVVAPAPVGVTGVATAVSNPTSLTVSWNAAGGAGTYKVYRLASPTTPVGAGNLVATTAGTSLVQAGLTAGTTYYYRVSAIAGGPGGGAESPPSDYAMARTFSDAAPSTEFPPLVMGAGQALLFWNGHNSGTSFRVYGGASNSVATINPNTLVTTTVLDPITGEWPWSCKVGAPAGDYAAFLLSGGLVFVLGHYWIAEVYPDGTESARSEVMPFPFL